VVWISWRGGQVVLYRHVVIESGDWSASGAQCLDGSRASC